MLDEGGPGPAAGNGEPMPGVLCCCVFVGGADEGDYEGLGGVEELWFLRVRFGLVVKMVLGVGGLCGWMDGLRCRGTSLFIYRGVGWWWCLGRWKCVGWYGGKG